MYDVYHIASETNANITDTCDVRDPNSLFAVSHSRGKGRTETRQTETLHHFKWSFFFLDPVCLLLSSMAVLCHVIGLLQRALQGKAWSTLQII